jgi:uncharacterized membrane protein
MAAVAARQAAPAIPLLRRLPEVLGAATVLTQIAYPLFSGTARNVLTMVVVSLFFAASVGHALVWRGARSALWLVAVTAGGGLAVEAVGQATGVPFGSYAYSDTLPPKLAGVPWVIPLAWTMMAYPALIVGRRISRGPLLGPTVAAAALAAWDLYLDPQMVAAGHWSWEPSRWALLDIPLTNFAGWFAAALLMMAVLWRRVDDRPADDRLPTALYLWTWAGSLVAHALFLGLPGSALVGGVGMGAVVIAFLFALRRA